MTPARDNTAYHPANKWIGLCGVRGNVPGFLDITVNVALPDITRSFGTDLQTVQWIIIFYVEAPPGFSLASAAPPTFMA